jgi:hypothetical protein
MKTRDIGQHLQRRDRLIREHVHDPYKLRSKLPEPSRCAQCGAVYRHGRWLWDESVADDAEGTLCQACHRVNDGYPAGEITIAGEFASAHRDEVINLARNIERNENAEHPLNRIMSVEDRDGAMVITTTDIHLPHTIGHALQDAWQGELETHYDEEGYFARVNWRRD